MLLELKVSTAQVWGQELNDTMVSLVTPTYHECDTVRLIPLVLEGYVYFIQQSLLTADNVQTLL